MGGPVKWSLGDEGPAPVEFEVPEVDPEVKPSDTHTGTDPNGRAIGPLEDHTQVKLAVGEKAPKRGSRGR